MLNLKFARNAGLSEADALAYIAALDAAYGMPREPPGAQSYAVPLANLAAQADPLDPAAAWAVDISQGQSPAGQDPDDEALFVTPTQFDASKAVTFPAGAVTIDLDMGADPEWWEQVIAP